MKKRIYAFILAFIFAFLTIACSSCNVNIVKNDSPSFDVLIENNELDDLLDIYENITLEGSFTTDGETNTYTKSFYEIEDEIVYDLISNGNDNSFKESFRNQVVYFNINDNYSFYLYDSCQPVFGFFDQNESFELVGNVYEEENYWVANYWTYEESELTSYTGTYYTVWFDQVTLFASKAKSVTYNENLEESVTFEVDFIYSKEEVLLEDTAYDMHVTNDNPIEIEFIFNNGSQDEYNLLVNTSKETHFGIIGNNGKELGAYANVKDVHNVTDLSTFNEESVKLFVLDLKPAISFECNFTEEHVEYINALINTMLEAGLEGNKEKYDSANEEYVYWIDYLNSQIYLYLIEYYKNPTNETASQNNFVRSAYYTLSAYMNETLKELLVSSPIKDYIFKGYTKEQLEYLQKDNTQIAELNALSDKLTSEYQLLDSNSPTWEDDVDRIYLEFIKVQHKIALLYGYDNYYDYASDNIYKRYFEESDRENLRKYVEQYIVPLYNDVYKYYNYYMSQVSNEDYNSYRKYSIGDLADFPELEGEMMAYFDTFKGTKYYDNLMLLFNDNAIVKADNPNSLGTAHASWDPIYKHSIVYVSYNYNNVYTIIHEAGHAASFYHYDFYDLKYDICEIHSQANELLFNCYLKDNLSTTSFDLVNLYYAINGFSAIISSTIVDEFEEEVYKAVAEDSDFDVEDMRKLREEVCSKYTTENGNISIDSSINYIRNVALNNPVYYLSYATSLIASYTYQNIAFTEGYEEAQAQYVDLLVNVNPDLLFKELVEELNLFSPFEESTFQTLKKMFSYSDIDFQYAREDVIFTEANEIKTLFELSKDNELVNFNEDGKVFMIFFTNNHAEKYFFEMVGTMLGDIRMLSADELIIWYEENKEDVIDWEQRLIELLGFKASDSQLYFAGMWVDVEDLHRLGYQSDVTKQVNPTDFLCDENGNYLSINDKVEESILEFRNKNLDYTERAIYTMLGYTYDLASDDHFGVSEFVLERYSGAEIEFKFNTADQLVDWLESQAE